MTTTTASGSANGISQVKRDPGLATGLRFAALALSVLAAASGVAYVFLGTIPQPLRWENQVLSAIWAMPVLSILSGKMGQRYPRSAAVLASAAGVLGLVLAGTAAGFSLYLSGQIILAIAAAAVSLYSIVADGDDIGDWRVRRGEVVRPDWVTRFAAAKVASAPMFMVVLGAFIGCSIWTIVFSFTRSAALPRTDFIGWAQYERLFKTARWIISVKNLAVYGVCSLFFSFVVGFLLAVFMDQKIRFESAFRTIFLYPFALSFIVTGHVWAWIMNPTFGLQRAVRDLGWTSFTFDWLGNRDMVVYTLVIAGLWQGTGLIMALMLAGLRGIDDEIWRAARIDGIPKWRTYISIVIPMMRPVLITTLVIAASGVVRIYDLVVALTQGGPGLFSEMPAKYVYDNMFQNALGQGLAASSVMLITTGIILIPWAIVEFGGRRRA
jgi:glucose/mannose transport system permease protein